MPKLALLKSKVLILLIARLPPRRILKFILNYAQDLRMKGRSLPPY